MKVTRHQEHRLTLFSPWLLLSLTLDIRGLKDTGDGGRHTEMNSRGFMEWPVKLLHAF